MKTNRATFLGTVAAPVLRLSRANLQQNRPLQCHRASKAPPVKPRPALIMIWRSNPTSGRLECQWTLERNAQVDEGVSSIDLLRWAA